MARASWPVLLAVAVAACGRLGFDAQPHGDDDDDAGGGDGRPGDATTGGPDAGPSTGTVGPRALVTFSGVGVLHVAGADGEAIAVASFQTAMSVGSAGPQVSGQAPFGSYAVLRFDPAGVLASTSVLDSTGYCDIRDLAMQGSDLLALGLTLGGTTDASLGACAIGTSRQDPVAIRVTRDGTQSALVEFTSGATNAQLLHATAHADGSLVLAGVYGDALAIGSNALPPVTADTGFVVGYTPSGDVLAWADLQSSSSTVTDGPVVASGSDTCAGGRIAGSVTMFGTTLVASGPQDAWVARLDATGTPRFLRQISSSGADSLAFDGAVAANGGGCVVTAQVDGDLAIDALSLPASGGPAVVLGFNAAGTATSGFRVPSAAMLATIGSRTYLAITVSAPIQLGSATYMPEGQDVVIGEIDAGGWVGLAGSVGGAGDQELESLAPIASDALAIGVTSTGALAFADQDTDSSSTTIHALATLGVTP